MQPVFPGSHSDTVPPDPIPNSEVKRISGDGSVGFPHVRVAHCQVPFEERAILTDSPFFMRDRKLVKPRWREARIQNCSIYFLDTDVTLP